MYDNQLEADDNSPLVFDPKNDHLNLQKDPEIRKMIGNETFLFSDEMLKKNKFGFNQARICIITDNSIYNLKNLKSKKLKRRFEIAKLKGITVSVAKGSQEFVIHGNEQEHDYLFLSKNKYIIIYIVEKVFEKLRGKQFNFIFTESSNLNNRMTTKKEKKENPKFSRMDDSELCDINNFFEKLYYNKKGKLVFDRNYDPFDDNEKIPFIKVGGNCNYISEYGNDYELNNYISGKGRATTRRTRESVGYMQVNFPNDKKLVGGGTVDDNEEEEMEEDEELDDDLIIKSAKLSDFTFLCCIGKGRNSSTYIARSEKYGAIYAIKVSDKEKLLLNEAVDSLRTEKKILSSFITDITFVVQMVYCFQTFDKIFFVYPFYRGGDLLKHMENNGGNFKNNENLLFFYICQLIVFLNKIHEGKIIY